MDGHDPHRRLRGLGPDVLRRTGPPATVGTVKAPHRVPAPALLPTALGALVVILLVVGTVLSSRAADAGGPAAPVSRAEARAAVAGVVALAAQRTPEAMRRLCAENDGCPGTSSSIEHTPQQAPGPQQAPRELCTVALPPTPSQAGSHLVVLEGTDGDGRAYVTQVLVDRAREGEDDEDGLEVQEPGFWLGVRYTALQHGRAWSSAGYGPVQPEVDDEQARRACTDTASWLSLVATR